MNPLLTAIQLVHWADERRSQDTLPLLVRRLVLASVDPSFIDFRAGDSVSRPGYDGVLRTVDGAPCVPAGQSVWEMGVDKSPAGKAKGDYGTRTADPLGITPADTTFVFVTPRRWQGKDEWADGKRAEGVWRDVQALDADDLEQWLDRHPAVGAWAARHVGRLPDGVRDLDDVWDGWVRRTTPPLVPAVFTAGRAAEADRVRGWLEAPPAVLRVRAATADEAVGFLGAVVQSLDESARDRVHARAVYVSTPEVWRAVAGNRSPAVLVAAAPDLGSEAQAVARGHHVAVVYGHDAAGVPVEVALPPLRRRELEPVLTGMGIDRERSDTLANESRGRIAVLADLLGGGTKAPAWATPAAAPPLVPFLLAGSWGQSAGDLEAVARLARATPDEVLRLLSRWANDTDPPVRLVGGGMWEWVSRQRAWPFLARYITAADFAAFRQVVVDVLGEVDPRLALDADRRWMASMYHCSPRYSDVLRKGLAETLAMLAACPDGVRAGTDPDGLVYGLVRELFGDTPDPARWYSLAPVLPLLAEASPDAVLAAVERGPVGDTAVRAAVFQGDAGLFGSSRHCHLLWALETLAWSAELLPRVAIALGGLTANDPGGRTLNRPANSLRAIFLPWRPYTTASGPERLAAIDALYRRYPAVAFNLCDHLLPCGPDSNTPTPRPKWRRWAEGYRDGVLLSEHRQYVVGLFERAAAWADQDPDRWTELLTPPKQVWWEQTDLLLDRLAALPLEEWADRPDDRLRRAVRHVLHQRRTIEGIYPQLTDAHLARLQAVYDRLAPADPIRRDAWLFDQSPELLTVSGNDWRAELEEAGRERQAVVQAILDSDRPDDLLRLADLARASWDLGHMVGQSAISDDVVADQLARCLDAEAEGRRKYAGGLVWGRFRRDGWAWVGRTFEAPAVRGWPDARKAAFADALLFETATWDWVEGWGEGAAAAYWRHQTKFVTDPHRDAPRAIRTLLARGRPFAALHLAWLCESGGRHPGAVSADQALEVLQAVTAAATGHAPAGDTPTDWHGFGHDVGELLTAVERAGAADERELARIEWVWLAVLENSRRGLSILHRALARDPAFFAEVVGLVYRPRFPDREDEPAPPIDEQTRSRAEQALRLLHDWCGVPGLGADGGLEGDVLREWVRQVREALHRSGYADIGDQEVGKVLAHVPMPKEPDAEWPPACVRDILEKLQADEVDKGFFYGVVNGRGVTCRSPFDGGELERELGAKYERWATALYASSRVVRILRQIAEYYKDCAQREDERRDVNEFR